MTVHLLRAAAATGLILLVTVLPFLPGGYDPLAAPLSMLARVFGFSSLLLVPVGVVWATASYWRPLAGRDYPFALAAIVVWSILSGLLSLAAFAVNGLSLGLASLALAAYLVAKLTRRIRLFKGEMPVPASVPILYFVVVPLAVVLLQQPIVRRGVEFSRNRAIRNAAPLIADIEQHRTERQTYPVSLLSVWRDYATGVIGIERFHYERSGDAYNLVFEQPAVDFGTREFVVYNPRDEQSATAHVMDILEFTPEHLERTRGSYAVRTTRHPHWKYFWFD